MSVYLLDPTSCFAISLNISSTPSPVLHEVLYTPEIRLLHCSHSVSMSESETCILDLRSYLLPQLSKKLVQCLNLCSDTKYCSNLYPYGKRHHIKFTYRKIFAFSAYVTISSRCCDRMWKESGLSKAKTRMAASEYL